MCAADPQQPLAIGRLERVPLQELWRYEERSFTPWLEDNLDVLSDAIGIRLSAVQRESAVGAFRVDLVVEDNEKNLLVIENQLEATDHDHLGKIITYLSNLEAKGAIWISPEPRPEHIAAITWLNESSARDTVFYLVRLEACRIGDSSPAPLFTVIVGPSQDSKITGKTKEKLANRHVLRREFFAQLLDRAKARGVTTHATVSPTTDNWLSTGAGRTGITYTYYVWLQDKTAVQLEIDTGDKERNEAIFRALPAHKPEIEHAFGTPLTWDCIVERRKCKVEFMIEKGGIQETQDRWPEIQDRMIDRMQALRDAFKPYISKLKL